MGDKYSNNVGSAKGCHENVEDQEEKLHEDVETVRDFSYLGDRIYPESECEAAVASRTRIGWVIFRDCSMYPSDKISSENQWNCIQKLCEISNALWKRDMVPRPE